MSFKILIADDEPIICKGLRDTIPWEKYDIEVIGVSYDGEDAIQKIQQNSMIDIVITDVRMPKVDGLELAAYIHDHYPHILLIMISGYEEFEYAQKAIQLGVKDYLLKPVDIDALISRVNELVVSIQSQRKKLEAIHHNSLKNAVIERITKFPALNDDHLQRFNHVELYPFISLLKDYATNTKDLTDNELNDLKLRWKHFIESELDRQGFQSISVFTEENVLLTSIIVDKEFDLEEVIALLKDTTWDEKTFLFVWNSTIITGLDKLKESLAQLTMNSKYVTLGTKKGIIYSITELERKSLQSFPKEMEQKLIEAVFNFEKDKIRNLSDHVFTHFTSHEFFLNEIVEVCRGILEKMMYRYESLCGKEARQLHMRFKQFVDVRKYNSPQQLQDLFNGDLAQIITILDLEHIDENDWMMERAKLYIKDYFKSTIKVYEVADVINISPNYFSSLFKQKMGRNFNEYVNILRVEEAKVLLADTPFKVNEISEQVGYQEYKYFVEVFKKFTGMTPTKYRKFIAGQLQIMNRKNIDI